MRKTLGAIALVGGLLVAGGPATADAPYDPPAVCEPYIDAMSADAVADHNYMVSLVDAAEQKVWRRDLTIEHLRMVKQIQRAKIRHQRHLIHRLRAEIAARG